jgi:hypothetical protein
MRRLRPLISALLLSASIGLAYADAAAQKPPPPPEAKPDAAPARLLDSLESAGLFAAARVTLVENAWRYRNGAGLNDEPTLETDREVFSQGFRFAGLKGCTLTLRNEDVIRLRPPGWERAGGPLPRYVAELYVELDRLSATKGKSAKSAHQKPENVRLYGAWGAEYKYKGVVAKSPVGLFMFPAGLRESRKYYVGESVTFTFDSREQSTEFDAAFRRAIKLCEAP